MENNYEGQFAVITGASSGIGYELAKKFAQSGFDLLIVAEDQGIVEAAQAFQTLGRNVDYLRTDLAQRSAVDELYRKIQETGRPVDAIAINAGVGVGGASFDKTDLEKELNLINLNIVSSVCLAKAILPDMIQRGEGRILFTSSIASMMPGPYEAVYSASKAFIQSFSEALRVENKDKGVIVTALLPGPTETNFFHRADMDDTKVGGKKKDDPALVAEQGFEALMAGKEKVVAGSLKNQLQAEAANMMPQAVAAKIHEGMTKPNSPKDR